MKEVRLKHVIESINSMKFLLVYIFSEVCASDLVTQKVNISGKTASTFCPQWVSFLDSSTGKCIPCTPCPETHLTVEPCEYNRDSLCRPLTDLAEHLQSVLQRNDSTESVLRARNDTSLLIMASVSEVTGFQSEAHQNDKVEVLKETEVPVVLLAVSLTAITLIFLIISIIICLRKRKVSHRTESHDPLRQNLLNEELDDVENDTQPLDLDELLAQRYGKSLVTNTYVP